MRKKCIMHGYKVHVGYSYLLGTLYKEFINLFLTTTNNYVVSLDRILYCNIVELGIVDDRYGSVITVNFS